jgi:hypothetical protein
MEMWRQCEVGNVALSIATRWPAFDDGPTTIYSTFVQAPSTF